MHLWLWLVYRWRLWRAGISEHWLRSAFSAIAQMDVDEWINVPGTGLWLHACGNQVHVRDYWGNQHATIEEAESYGRPMYEFVMKDGIAGDVYVDEWRKEERIVRLEYGTEHVTNWWEVFRTGRRLDSLRFVPYLRKLYEKGA